MSQSAPTPDRKPWWRSIGPGLITACLVFGPGSLLVSANAGARYGYELLWLLVLTAILMGTYVTMGARVGVVGGASPCTLLAARLGRPAAALVGITLCLTCTTFQFANNLAFAFAARALIPGIQDSVLGQALVLVAFNAIIITFLFRAKQVYRTVERLMKIMVGLILCCFAFNLVVVILKVRPELAGILRGFIPGLPEGLTLALPERVDGAIRDPMILVAGLLGTTFSLAGAFYQGNLVRERRWKIGDYKRGVGDALAGVAVLSGVSMVILVTTATMIPGREASDIAVLARSLAPLLGTTAYLVFCVGLVAVASNPFLINAMIGGSILADAAGKPARLGDAWSRRFTVAVLLIGMAVAILALRTGENPVKLIIFGQALTIIGNPLMAASLLWLANRRDVMGERRNTTWQNVLGTAGLVVVILMALRVSFRVALGLGF